MRCQRDKCGYEWEPRTVNPKCCPKCKQYLPYNGGVKIATSVENALAGKFVELISEPPEPWVFNVKDKQQYAEDGKVYRQQYLLPDGKRTRTVEVDADDLETIVRVK